MFGYNCPIFIFQVVFEDALDLKEAVDICYNAIFGNHGQNCCAGNFIRAGSECQIHSAE